MAGGLRGGEASGELGFVTLPIADRDHISPPLTMRFLLLRDDSAPPILGFGDLLTGANLRCDFPNGTAYLEFPPPMTG